MPELDLTPIKARLARARHLPIFLTEGDIAKARENRKGLYRWHLEGTWDDAVLFGRARDDIAALVAEVERLQKEDEELRKGHDRAFDQALVAAEPHLRRKWADEARKLLNMRADFQGPHATARNRGIHDVISLLEGAGE